MRKKHGDLLALVVLVVCKYGGGRGGWTYTGRRELGTAYASHTPAKLNRPWCVSLVLLSANHCLSRVFRLPGSESACFDRISFIHPRLRSLVIEIETGPLICRSSRTYHCHNSGAHVRMLVYAFSGGGVRVGFRSGC